MTGKGEMPGAYEGREPAFVKHTLLEAYLEKLFLIVGMAAGRGSQVELCYVDGFAGPWGDESETMDTTSIAISLRTLDQCRQALGERGVSAKIRALYVEENGRAYERLAAYLKTSTPAGIEATPLKGDFVALRKTILEWAGGKAFVFFFIDPQGWKEVGIGTLRMLLQRPRSEFLINFMYDFVNRTMSMPEWQQDMAALLGEAIKVDGMTPEQRERSILKTYRKNLKHCVPTGKAEYKPRAAYVRVLDRDKERPKYHLVYVTSHPKGIIAFMTVSEGVDLVQKQVRARKKAEEREQSSGMSDLFGSGSLVDPTAGHASPEDVDRYWLAYLRDGTRRIGNGEFAAILEETDWFPGDLQSSLVRLVGSGAVDNLDADGKRPKRPLHFEDGERLQLRGA